MAGGVSSNNSSGYTSGNTSGNSQSNTTGSNTGQFNTSNGSVNNGTANGTTTGFASGQYNTGVVTNPGYDAAYGAANPSGSMDFLKQYFQNQTGNGSYTLGNLSQRAASGDPAYAMYAAPKDVVAQNVDPSTGAAFMGNYTQPWQAVTDSALNAYDVGADKTIGAFRTANAPFQANSRRPLGEAALTNEIGAGRGALAGQLLGQGYTTAANLGQSDANRAAATKTGNADRSLQAGQFNNTMTNQRQQFDVGSAYQGDQARNQSASSLLQTVMGGNASANDWLRLAQSTFGTTGSNTGNNTGTTSGVTSNTASGTSSGTNSGTNTSDTTGSTTGSYNGQTSGSGTNKGAGFDASKGISKLLGL